MEAKESKFNITETIKTIRKAREELQAAVKVEAAVSHPLLTDISMLGDIYRLFCDALGKHEDLSVTDRQKFIFIVLYLYAPRSLCGSKMPSGLRLYIVKAVGINIVSQSAISREAADVYHHYFVYTQFRQEVNRIFGVIVEALRQQGAIK